MFALILDRPALTLAMVVLFVAGISAFSYRFELDASAESLVLENDQSLKYYRAIRARYGSDDFLIVTYKPADDLFAVDTLRRIKSLRDELSGLDYVASVTSLLDVPLLRSPPLNFSQLRQGGHRLLSPETDINLARREFTSSPLYKNLLVSADGDTAGLFVDFNRDETYYELLHERNALRERQLQAPLPAAEQERLRSVSRQFRQHSEGLNERTRQHVAEIRGILDRHRAQAEIHLAGIPMIVSDIISFIWHDLRVFGTAVLSLIVVLLALAFRRLRWVAIPLLICVASAAVMIGALGLLQWPLTVVSSNFLPVLLIITLSLNIHLIVRHEELRGESADESARTLIRNTVGSKFLPCLYTALTTMVAFGSLLVSGIRPVIDFGWLMVTGVLLSLVLTFLAFPATLRLLPRARKVRPHADISGKVTVFFADLVEGRAAATMAVAVLVFAVSAAGVARLSVENRFIDYFDVSTEIHQGMVEVDRELGGTTPLDVIIDAPAAHLNRSGDGAADSPQLARAAGGGLAGSSYWFNMFRLDDAKKIHDYLESLPETGKVLSIATSVRLMEQLNGGAPLNSFTLSVAYQRMPDDTRKRLFDPYLSDDGNQLRFAVRVYESTQNLRRGELIRKIRTDLAQRFDLAPEQVHLTGMTVLYNNMLQSLFQSQILSFSFVFVAVFLMFLAVFRSLWLSVIALVPNVLVAATVLGLMGWLGIPLDMMTITIAAIAMGIAVDDTIHYVHRYRAEFEADGRYSVAARRSHGSIGRAIFYTTITITLGFAILALSDFVPAIYFGMLAGSAMLAALIADLTLLPAMLATFRPFGAETKDG